MWLHKDSIVQICQIVNVNLPQKDINTAKNTVAGLSKITASFADSQEILSGV
jgi:hypothetical protein